MWTNFPRTTMRRIVQLAISPIFSSIILVAYLCPLHIAAQTAQLPSFGSSFSPETIGPGGVSTLTFTIINTAPIPAGNVSFTNILPAGMTIAKPANASCGCDGTLTVQQGGNSIIFSGGRLDAGETFTINVNVTSNTLGPNLNVSGELTSTLGNSGTTSASLEVTADKPGFSMSFSPDAISTGETSTLTLVIDNSLNTSAAEMLAFAAILPAGITFATPNNLIPGCGATVDGNTLSLTGATVDPESTCSISVDVQASMTGVIAPVELSGTVNEEGFTSSTSQAKLQFIPSLDLRLFKSFINDPVAPGDEVSLQFTLTNFDRSSTADNISFTDVIDQSLTGLSISGGISSGTCTGSLVESTPGTLSYSGGSLGPGASCSFSVNLDVPSEAARGAYPNATSTITYNAGGNPMTTNPATDELQVETAPRLTKTFLDDPFIAPGNSVVLQFSITNTSLSYPMTAITFTDDFDAVSPTATNITPVTGGCGSSSFTFTQSSSSVPARLMMSGGSLDPGATCTFSIELDILAEAPSGTYPNTTSEVSATIQGESVIGLPASDDLTIVAAPVLTKSFIRNQVPAGDTVTLTFTLAHSVDAPGSASNISFEDDLTAMLPGLAPEAGFVTMLDVCGQGSMLELDGTSLKFSGGSLAAGESCSFDVVLVVPGTAVPGSYTNTTSVVTADVLGLTTSSKPATDNLEVPNLTLKKEFLDDPPIVPGEAATLNFTLTNYTGSPIDEIAFADDLESTLSGLQLISSTNNCGGTLTGSSIVDFSGGSLTANSSCTISLQLKVLDASPDGSYLNTTSIVTALLDGNSIEVGAAKDYLDIFDTDKLPEAKATYSICGTAVTLTGSTSITFNPPISSFAWSEVFIVNGVMTQVPIASGEISTVNLSPGQHNIKLTIIDGYGTDDEQIIVLVDDNQDNQAPMITCPADATIFVDASCQASLPDYTGIAMVTDNCNPNPSVIQSPAPGTLLSGHGTTQVVTLTADDGNGNTSQCSFTVTLVDNIDPVIICPDGSVTSFIREVGPSCTAILPDYRGEAVVTDNCTASPIVTQSPSPGTLLSGHGTTQLVTLTADDGNGNTSQCSFTVTLVDNIDPVITCPVVGTAIRSTNPGLCTYTIVGNEFNATALDNCGIVSLNYVVSGETSGTGPSLAGKKLVRGINIITWTTTDVAGITRSCSFTVDVKDDQNPTDYIIYVTKEAKFGENSTIGGDVGVTDAGGKAEFKINSVLDPNKVIAADIKVDLPSQVNNRMLSPATGGPTPPFLVYNGSTSGLSNIDVTVNNTVLNGSWKDVKVKKNITATLTGDNFGKITIEEGASVTFTAGLINLEELKVEKGNEGVSVTSVLFPNPTYVKVKEKVSVARDSRVNVNGPKVTFYIYSNNGFEVEGENSQVTANIMAPTGQVKVGNGTVSRPAIMTGWYIADKVNGGKYNFWNKYSCSGTPTASPYANVVFETFEIHRAESSRNETQDVFDVRIYPNPSSTDFKIQLVSTSNEPVIMRVVDLTGRMVSFKTNVALDTEIDLGNHIPAGTYFAEIIQGRNRKTVRLIKLN